MFQQLFYVLLATYLDDDLLNGKSVNSRNIGFKGSLFKAINILSSGKSQQPDSFPLDGCLMLEEQCKLPAPLISMDSSDELCITLISGNTSLEPETFHIHRGQEVLDLKKLNRAQARNILLFFFKLPSPGTYYYHCHRKANYLMSAHAAL